MSQPNSQAAPEEMVIEVQQSALPPDLHVQERDQQNVPNRNLQGEGNSYHIEGNGSTNDPALQDASSHQENKADDEFEKGNYIDVRDFFGDWKVGIIVGIQEKNQKVHIQYEGQSQEEVKQISKIIVHDFYISTVHSDWIKQTLSIQTAYKGKQDILVQQAINLSITGYTGEKNNAIRTLRNIAEIKQMMATFVEMEKNNFQGVSAFQYNQHARGRYFFGLDQALQNISYENEEPYEVLQLMKDHIHYTIRYLKNFPNLFADKNWKIVKEDSYQNEIDGQQIIQIYSTSLLEDEEEGDDTQMQEENIYAGSTKQQKDKLRQKIKHEISPYLINYFWREGGTEAVKELMTSNISRMIPLSGLFQLIRLLSIGLRNMIEQVSTELIELAVNYTTERLTQLNEREIREFDSYQVKKIRERLQEVAKLSSSIDVQDELLKRIDEMELNISLKLLTSQFLNKKIQGLNDISDIISDIKYNQTVNSPQGELNQYDLPNNRRITPKEFTSWIIDNQIIDHLLGDSLHVEIVSRCHEILKFMCTYKDFPLDLIDTIWNSCGLDKHEAIVSAIYELIIQISDNLSKPALFKFHEKINSRPINEVNESTLHLIKGFSSKAICRLLPIIDNYKQSQGENEEESDQNGSTSPDIEKLPSPTIDDKLFCLNYLWRIIQETEETESLSPQIIDGAIAISKEILSMPQSVSAVRKYSSLCLQSISSGISSYQQYSLLLGILDNYCAHELLSFFLNKLKIDFPHLIVQEITSYMKSFPTDQNFANTSFEAIRFRGKFTHELNLLVRLALLEGVLCKVDSESQRIYVLSSVDFDNLWNCFVVNPNHPSERLIFISWIYKKTLPKPNSGIYYNPHTDINHLFTFDLMKHIFFNILCNQTLINLQTFSLELLSIFLYFFKKVNIKEKNIELLPSSQKFKVITSELAGRQILWDIFQSAQDKQVIEGCCEQLSDIYLNHERVWDPTFREDYLKQLTNKCLELVQEGFEEQDESLIDKSVKLLILFFYKFEGENIERQYQQMMSNTYFQYGVPFSFSFTLATDNSKKEIKFHPNTPFGIIRRKVAQEFNLPLSCLRFYCKHTKQFIDSYQDEEILMRAQTQFTVNLITGADTKIPFHPKNFIVANDHDFDLLFSVLSVNFCSEDCHNNLWELILKLPSNEHIKQGIFNMDEQWNVILKGSFHKKLYCLNLIQDFFEKGSTQSKTQQIQNHLYFIQPFQIRIQRFIETGGYKHLHEMLVELDVNIIQSALSKKFISKLLKVITLCQSCSESKEALTQNIEDQKLLDQTFVRLIEVINRICEYCLQRELEDIENCAQEKNSYFEQFFHYQRSLQSQQQQQAQSSQQQQQQQEQQQLQIAEPKMPEFFGVEKDIVYNAMIIINKNQINKLDLLFTHTLIESIIRKGFAQIDNSPLQQFIEVSFEHLFQLCTEKQKIFAHILPLLLDKILPDIANNSVSQANSKDKLILSFQPERTQQFFKFTSFIIIKSRELKQDYDQNVLNLTEMIVNRPIVETSQNHKDDVMIGLLSILKEMLMNPKAELCLTLQKKYNLVQSLLDGIFEFPQKKRRDDNEENKKIRGPKFKTPESRKHSFDLLSSVALNCSQNLQLILQYLHPLLLRGDWRTKSNKHWEIVPKKNEKSSTGYVGIKNLGCICYMNSLLQQMFMIPSFRDDILKCKDPSYGKCAPEDNILYQLKCMFTSLCYSEKEAYNPKAFCNAFKDYDGNPTNVFEQMDIDEFFNSLMDKLENQMKGTKHQDSIKNHFGGVLSNEIISKGCQHYSEREEIFLALSLQVKNKKDVKQSLEALIQGEMLEGDNAYHCEQCNKKVTALKRTCLKKLPNHMILVLKRFEFNYDSMQKMKLNQFCSFPEEIDFTEFSQQGLRKMEHNDNNKSEQNNQKSENEYPESYFKYRLNGIVIHMGIADSGHYYSYIRERGQKGEEPKWMEFNDNIVKPFDPKEIANEAFGGDEKWRKANMKKNMYLMNAIRQKIRNAYLLFYDRIEPFSEEEEKQKNQKKEEEQQQHVQKQDIIQRDIEEEQEEEIDQSHQTSDPSDKANVSKDVPHSNQVNTQNQMQQEKELNDENQEEFYCGALHKELQRINKNIQLKRIFLSDEFNCFLNDLIINLSPQPSSLVLSFPFSININKHPHQSLVLQTLQFICTFFLTTLIRQKNVSNLTNMIHQRLLENVQKNLGFSQWLIKAFTDPLIIEEIILSPSLYARQQTVQLLEEASKMILRFEDQILAEDNKNYQIISRKIKINNSSNEMQTEEIEEKQVTEPTNQKKESLSSNDAQEIEYCLEVIEERYPLSLLGQLLNCIIECLDNKLVKSNQIFQLLFTLSSYNAQVALFLHYRAIVSKLLRVLFKQKKKNFENYISDCASSSKCLQYEKIQYPLLGYSCEEINEGGFQSQKKRKLYQFDKEGIFLWKLLECFIRQNISHPVNIQYLNVLGHSNDLLTTFISLPHDKSCLLSASKIIAFICQNNNEYLCKVIKIVCKILTDKQSITFMYTFAYLNRILHIQDNQQIMRAKLILRILIPSINQNESFSEERNVCTQFLIKLASWNPAIAEELCLNYQDWLTSWMKIISSVQNMSESDLNKQIFNDCELLIYGIKLPRNMKEVIALRNWNLKALDKIKKGQAAECKSPFDVFDLIPENYFLSGKILDFLEENGESWKLLRVAEIIKSRNIIYCYELNSYVNANASTIDEEKAFYEKQDMLRMRQISFFSPRIAPYQSLSQHPSEINGNQDEEEEEEEEGDENLLSGDQQQQMVDEAHSNQEHEQENELTPNNCGTCQLQEHSNESNIDCNNYQKVNNIKHVIGSQPQYELENDGDDDDIDDQPDGPNEEDDDEEEEEEEEEPSKSEEEKNSQNHDPNMKGGLK